jgi:uncharacterized membrane protein YhaH (DUF805 family)
MTVGEALVSFKGRMSRSDYWLKGVLPLLPFTILNYVLWHWQGEAHFMALVLSLILLGPQLTLLLKRLHDRNYSGWVLIGTDLVALADALDMLVIFSIFLVWLSVQVGFLRGTVGPNHFGNDPLLGMGDAERPFNLRETLGVGSAPPGVRRSSWCSLARGPSSVMAFSPISLPGRWCRSLCSRASPLRLLLDSGRRERETTGRRLRMSAWPTARSRRCPRSR